jgi:cob(I)alamin adenosyltransferase
MSTEYSVIDNGIVEFYGDLDECVSYVMENRHYSGTFQIRLTDSFFRGSK